MHQNQGALAHLDIDRSVAELANGAMLKQIAARYGVDKSAVYRKLRQHPDYRDAIALQAHTWVEDAMQDLREATDETVNIARARADAAFKYAKAHNPDYQDKHQVTIEVGPELGAALREARERLASIRGGNNGGNIIDVCSANAIESIGCDSDSGAVSANESRD